MEDSLDKESNHDFGKNVIPKLLIEGKTMYAYTFKGYWKDVGTVDSLWEANMDLLKENSKFNLYERTWPIYSVSQYLPPHYINNKAIVKKSLINEGCKVYGKVLTSVLFYDVEVGLKSEIRNSVIMPEAKIGENVTLDYCLVQQGVKIPDGIEIIGNENNVTLVSQKLIDKLFEEKVRMYA